jgi:hypothetical protein
MKKLLVLLFSIIISFNSYGEWKYITSNTLGDDYYVDYSFIKESNGDLYFWYLNYYLELTPYGRLSAKMYVKTDFNTSKTKHLTYIFYNEPMGGGNGDADSSDNPTKYPDPNSVFGVLLREVCDNVQ